MVALTQAGLMEGYGLIGVDIFKIEMFFDPFLKSFPELYSNGEEEI